MDGGAGSVAVSSFFFVAAAYLLTHIRQARSHIQRTVRPSWSCLRVWHLCVRVYVYMFVCVCVNGVHTHTQANTKSCELVSCWNFMPNATHARPHLATLAYKHTYTYAHIHTFTRTQRRVKASLGEPNIFGGYVFGRYAGGEMPDFVSNRKP